MPSWKKLIVSGSDATLNSLTVTNDVTILGSTFLGDSQSDVVLITGSASVTGSLSINDYTLPLADGIYPNSIIITNGAGTLEFDISKTIYEEVKNTSGGTLPKGTPVYVVDTTGNTNNVAAADAADPSKMPASFILEQELAPDQEGLGIILGFINQIDTSGLTAGQVVYVAPGGGFTQTRPTGSALVQPLGIPVKIDPTNGSGIVFNPGTAQDLPNLQAGYFWLGDSNGVPTSASVDSIRSGSFSGSFQGDGSGLTNLPASDPFPYTGSAIISGSLQITGSVSTDTDATVNGLTLGRGAGSVDSNTAVGTRALSSNTTGARNTAIGIDTLRNNTTGFNNTALGNCALCSHTTGFDNVALGNNSLRRNTTGFANTAINTYALYNNTTGTNNVAVGYRTLFDNTGGSRNTAVGNFALRANSTGNFNVAIGNAALLYSNFGSTSNNANVAVGSYALCDNTTGNTNTGLGVKTLKNNTTGGCNTGIGGLSLYANTSGICNTAVGTNSLQSTTTGTRNTALGNRALQGNTTGQCNTGLGHQALWCVTTGTGNVGLGSYQALYKATQNCNIFLSDGAGNLRLYFTGSNGDAFFSSAVSASVFKGDGSELTGISTTPFPYTGSAEISGSLTIDGTLTATSIVETSSEKFKEHIQTLYSSKEKILELRPVSFNRKESSKKEIGFIAEEVEKVYPEVVKYNEQEEVIGIEYSRLVAPIVDTLQELIQKIQEQAFEIETLKTKLGL